MEIEASSLTACRHQIQHYLVPCTCLLKSSPNDLFWEHKRKFLGCAQDSRRQHCKCISLLRAQNRWLHISTYTVARFSGAMVAVMYRYLWVSPRTVVPGMFAVVRHLHDPPLCIVPEIAGCLHRGRNLTRYEQLACR